MFKLKCISKMSKINQHQNTKDNKFKVENERGRIKISLIIFILILSLICVVVGVVIYNQGHNIGLLQGKVSEEKDEILAVTPVSATDFGNCTWELDSEGTLTIKPKPNTDGVLGNFAFGTTNGKWGPISAWGPRNQDIRKVVFSSGVKADWNSCYGMFWFCENLTSIDFSDFDTQNATSFYAMFYGCYNLESIDISNFNTSNVTVMAHMFRECRKVKSISFGNNFKTNNVTDMTYMFTNCCSLQTLDLSTFNTANVDHMEAMFNEVHLSKIKLGKDYNFKLNSSTVRGGNFGRGTWLKEEDGKEYSAVDICQRLSSDSVSVREQAAGTYTKINNISREMIEKIKDITNESVIGQNKIFKIEKIERLRISDDSNSIYRVLNNKALVAKISQSDLIYQGTAGEYKLPGKLEVIFDNSATDEKENYYDIKITFEDLHLYDYVYPTGVNSIIFTILDNQNENIRLKKYVYKNEEDFENNIGFNTSNFALKYRMKLEIVNKNGTPVNGNYLFSAYDIDIPSYKYGGASGIIQSEDGAQGYGEYSEGVNLIDGFNFSTLKFVDNTFLQDLGNYHIRGTRIDQESESSEFIVIADASETEFEWTASAGETLFFGTYQPQLVEFIKESDNTNRDNVENAKLALYNNIDNSLIEQWTTSNENKKIFLMPGDYTLKEIEAPEGYNTSSDIRFFVDTNYKIIVNDTEITDGKIVMTDNRRSDLSYTVRYYEKGTTNSLLPDNTVLNQVYQDVIQSADVIEEIPGFTYDSADKESLTIGLDETANVITLYYTRNNYSYTVKHVEKDNEDNELCEPEVITNQPYGTEITSETNKKEFTGYIYDSADKDTLTIGADEDENVITLYYRRRNDLGYVIHYKEQGTEAELLTDKVETGYEYEAEVGESAEDIDGYTAMTPTSVELKLLTDVTEHTFWYQKRNDLSYKVRHVEKDNVTHELYPEETVTGQVYKTEVEPNGLKKTIAGYTYDSADKEKLIIGTNEDENIITLYYVKRTGIPYVVHYREEGTNKPVAEDKQGTPQEYGASVTEQAIDIEGYEKIEPTTETIEIEDDGNEIIFYYKVRDDLSYKVRYLEEGTTNELEPEKTVENQTYGTEITAESQRKEFTGYRYVRSDKESITIGTNEEENVITLYYEKITGLSYVVHFWDKDTNEEIKTQVTRDGKAYGDRVESEIEKVDIPGYDYDSVDKDELVITDGENEINFYYTKKNNLSYIVRYIDKQTNEEIDTAKTVGGKTYKDKVQASSEIKEITGYIYDSANQEELIIDVEGNEIRLYYVKRNDLSYTVHYVEQGTNNQVAEDKVVTNKTYKQTVTENAIK